jgi:hypothetical protein
MIIYSWYSTSNYNSEDLELSFSICPNSLKISLNRGGRELNCPAQHTSYISTMARTRNYSLISADTPLMHDRRLFKVWDV